MSRRCWPVAMIALLWLGHSAWGQFIVPYGGGFELNIGKARKNFAFNLSVSRGYGGYYYGNPYGGFGYGPSFGSYGFTQVQVVSPPPIIFAPPPEPLIIERPVLLAPARLPNDILNPPPIVLPDMDGPPDRPLPGQNAGKFRLIDPKNRDKARQPVKPDPPPMPPLPQPPAPEADPQRESARQIELGKEAFREKQYGRAVERFQLAMAAAPNQAEPHFLLAQTHLALSNYRRAYESIQSGLRLQPDWPMRRFRPIELYADVAEYAVHLTMLEDTQAGTPNDAVLLFLQAYALWFDGRVDGAAPMFRKAAPALPDPGVVDFFLRALPGVPLV